MGALDTITSVPERGVRAFDRWQGRRSATAVPVAVVRKYADDRGSAMAALFTYYAFMALFPLLVLLLTGLDRALNRWPGLRVRIVDTVIGQLPVIGPRLQDETASLAATGFGLVIGVGGLLWGSTGLYNSAQLAMSQVWNVEGVDRMGLVSRLARALLLFATLFSGAAVAAAASQWGATISGPEPARDLGLLAGFVINIVVVLAALRVVTAPVVPWRRLLLPAALAGVAWQVLQLVGQWLVTRRLSHMGDLYGVFAYALGALLWLTLMARIIVLAVEVGVVVSNRLYPRRIAQPPLTAADRQTLDRIVRNERRRPEQHIDIRWDDEARACESTGDGAGGRGSGGQRQHVPHRHDDEQDDDGR